MVKLTNSSNETVYDRWLKNNPNQMKDEPKFDLNYSFVLFN